jgi:hypothetical protein
MARPEITGKKRPKATGKRGPPVEAACYSIRTFCLAHHISEALYFKLKSKGLGPQEAEAGSRILITFEAAAIWRSEREAAAAENQSRANEQAPQPAA